MNKKYIVRLSAKERRTLRELIRKLKGSSQKVRRAQMLLKADVAARTWTDEQIAAAFESRARTVEKLRERFVSEGFEQTLHGKPREQPATEKILGGKPEAQLIAMRLGPPPKGYANWTTPKHGSWLNIAENELSSLTRQCVSGRRFSNLTNLQTEIKAWSNDLNHTQRGVDWQMRITDARYKLIVPLPENQGLTKH